MDLFDDKGSFLGEGKAIFDSEGNLIGHFLETAKEGVESAFEGSWLWGILFLFFVAPWLGIIGVVLFLIIKLIRLVFWIVFSIIKIALRLIWWLIRLPFCLIFRREFPNF